MKKNQYKVETPLGTFKRATWKTYSHLVVIKHYGSTYTRWTSRKDLAEKEARKWINGWSKQGQKVPPAEKVLIVPVAE